VLPELDGKIEGSAIRVPTANVSMTILTAQVSKSTTADEVNAAMRAAASGPLKGILGVEDRPLVSIDFNGNPHSSTVDSALTNVVDGDLVTVQSWYDNEWGFSNRMVDLLRHISTAG
jgi:glyceraldehyde 3-phosphate dehydrogenase